MSMYMVCMSVALWWMLVGIGMPFFRVVLPLIDSRAGPYMGEAHRTCSAVTVVFWMVPSFRARIILASGGDANLR